MEIKRLEEKNEWKKMIKNSSPGCELIIFKFSPICGLSHSVDLLLDNWCKIHSGKSDIEILKVDVINSRSLSRRIAKDLKIKHESPQLIWLDKDMKVKHDASHYDITNEELNKQL
jgi:bacillithiol system protein YtxJ